MVSLSRVLLYFVHCVSISTWSIPYSASFGTTQTTALKWLNEQESIQPVIDSGFIEISLGRSWTDALDACVNKWSEDKAALALLTHSIQNVRDNGVRMLARIESHRKSATNVPNSSDNILPKVSPAFQWAQSPSNIYIQVKLSYRWSSPGALSVQHENVTLLPTLVVFSGIGMHSTIQKSYELQLPLHTTIIPETVFVYLTMQAREIHGTAMVTDGGKSTDMAISFFLFTCLKSQYSLYVTYRQSTWYWGSVGKLSITLKKEDSEIWPRLLSTNVKIPNMHVWHEMAEAQRFEKFANTSSITNDTKSGNSSASSSPNDEL